MAQEDVVAVQVRVQLVQRLKGIQACILDQPW